MEVLVKLEPRGKRLSLNKEFSKRSLRQNQVSSDEGDLPFAAAVPELGSESACRKGWS